MGLFDALRNLPTLNEVKGSYGEFLAKTFSKTFTNALVLHDVLIDGAKEGTSQIDLIMIGTSGVYVIEVKNYSPDAMIYGNGQRHDWYYYLGGRKYTLYNPLKQNAKHIEYLKTFLKDFGDIPYYNIVLIICKDFKVDDINIDKNKLLNAVCNSLPALIRTLRILSEQTPDALSEEVKQEIYNFIQNNQYIGKEKRIEHKENVRAIKKEIADTEKQNLCPYCNSELILKKVNMAIFMVVPIFQSANTQRKYRYKKYRREFSAVYVLLSKNYTIYY